MKLRQPLTIALSIAIAAFNIVGVKAMDVQGAAFTQASPNQINIHGSTKSNLCIPIWIRC